MNLQEYITQIVSNDIENWTLVGCWGAGSGPSFFNKYTVYQNGQSEFSNLEIDSHNTYASLQSNLSISMAWGITSNDNFVTSWSNQFPDSKATSHFLDLFYNGALVYRVVYVAVDGGRCYLPIPETEYDHSTNQITRLHIPQRQYELFKLINLLHGIDIDSYINRVGIQVTSAMWPL